MNIRASFTEPTKERSSAFRYGMLVACLLLLAFHIQWRLTLSPDYRHDRNGNGVVALMLLFNNLAYQFRWPTSVPVALRLLLHFLLVSHSLPLTIRRWPNHALQRTPPRAFCRPNKLELRLSPPGEAPRSCGIVRPAAQLRRLYDVVWCAPSGTPAGVERNCLADGCRLPAPSRHSARASAPAVSGAGTRPCTAPRARAHRPPGRLVEPVCPPGERGVGPAPGSGMGAAPHRARARNRL